MNFKKILKRVLLIFVLLILILLIYFFVGSAPKATNIAWGVNFSQKHARNLGLDWKEAFTALLDDLGARNLKIAVHWDGLEPKDGEFYFDDTDWQVNEAEKRNANIILVIGMKTTRWPECHLPDWAQNLSKEQQQEKILIMLEKIVLRYKDSKAIWSWQLENEPFFPFGICPWVDKKFLRKEIDLVKSLDQKPIIEADSGEGSFWFQAAEFGDIPSTTMYKKVWFRQINSYVTYYFPPVFYWRKAQIIKFLFNKKVICGEFQAEPFGPKLIYDITLEEQEKTMNLERFKKNIDFAKKTGFDTFYLWGSEWWYWMKEKQNQPGIWNEAKTLFK
jgi:hypothetical protein